MSEVKIHRVRYKLATKLREGAKISVATAQQAAQDRVREIEPRLLAAIDGELKVLDEGYKALQAADAAGAQVMYETADRIVGLAGAAPRLEALGKASLSLCDLLHSLHGAVPNDLRPIAVHIDALRVLKTDLPEGGQMVVLGGLTKLRDHYTSKAPAGEA